MSDNNQAATTGFPILGLLGVCFVVLKLCRVINWSWWWVLLPFYAWIPIVAIAFLIVFLLALLGIIK